MADPTYATRLAKHAQDLDADGHDINAIPSETVIRDIGRWEVVMAPGVTSPPDPVQTPDGSDFVYMWVSGV